MSVAFKHADGPGKIKGKGQNGTPTMDFVRLTTGQMVFVSVDFTVEVGKGSVSFEVIAGDQDAVPVTPNKATVSTSQHVYKRALFRVTKESDPAVGVVEVPFEVNFSGGDGSWRDFTFVGETVTEH